VLKILTFIAPFILKGASKNPAKSFVGLFAFYGLIFFGFLFILFAIYTWLMKTYSVEVAFLGIGLLFILGALAIKIEQWRKRITLRFFKA